MQTYIQEIRSNPAPRILDRQPSPPPFYPEGDMSDNSSHTSPPRSPIADSEGKANPIDESEIEARPIDYTEFDCLN